MQTSSTNLPKLSLNTVLHLHQRVMERAKTQASVHDLGLLDSAINRPFATFSGHDLYPTIFSKAAALLQSLCLNHPFTDGNKRTAWASTHLFLHLNGFHLHAPADQAVTFVLDIDRQKLTVQQIASWLKSHSHTFKDRP